MSLTVLGIDPGMLGAIGWTDGETAHVVPMPILAGRPDLTEFERILSDVRPGLVVIETVETRPGEGAVGALSAGINWGLLAGVLVARGHAWQEVKPAAWKRAMGLPGNSASGPKGEEPQAKADRLSRAKRERKEQAVLMAERLFPSVDLRRSERSRKPNDGMAEALLIAEFGRRTVKR